MAHEPTGTVTTESTRRWRDRKRYLWLIGLMSRPSLSWRSADTN